MASYLNDTEKAGTKTLQKLLRHKSQRTTEIYLHEIDNAQKSVLEAIEGRFSEETVEELSYKNNMRRDSGKSEQQMKK
jgi:hypothetical protein